MRIQRTFLSINGLVLTLSRRGHRHGHPSTSLLLPLCYGVVNLMVPGTDNGNCQEGRHRHKEYQQTIVVTTHTHTQREREREHGISGPQASRPNSISESNHTYWNESHRHCLLLLEYFISFHRTACMHFSTDVRHHDD